jgi:hypothetical protein
MSEITCFNCGKALTTAQKKAWLTNKRHFNRKMAFCSKTCYFQYHRGANHVCWKGGRFPVGDGYIRVNTGANRTRDEHRVLVEKILGRRLDRKVIVHHIDGNKTNNRPANFLLCSAAYHTWLEKEMARRYAQEHFGGGG